MTQTCTANTSMPLDSKRSHTALLQQDRFANFDVENDSENILVLVDTTSQHDSALMPVASGVDLSLRGSRVERSVQSLA